MMTRQKLARTRAGQTRGRRSRSRRHSAAEGTLGRGTRRAATSTDYGGPERGHNCTCDMGLMASTSAFGPKPPHRPSWFVPIPNRYRSSVHFDADCDSCLEERRGRHKLLLEGGHCAEFGITYARYPVPREPDKRHLNIKVCMSHQHTTAVFSQQSSQKMKVSHARRREAVGAGHGRRRIARLRVFLRPGEVTRVRSRQLAASAVVVLVEVLLFLLRGGRGGG